MGLIKKIFGGIFGLIGGIFGAIGRIFGFGKKDDFFMELDETAQPVAEAVEQVVGSQSPVDAAAPVKVTAPPKDLPQEEKASFKEQIPAAPQLAPTQQGGPVAVKMPEIPNFATDYLVNPKVNFSPRRRPGPSLSSFKDMAKQVGNRSTSMG
ncbi:MAG: hypothetical protein AAF722_08310 [Cyanobacteria bacterium P01_C01_bin.70]